jgi:flagellar assembly protein FliH
MEETRHTVQKFTFDTEFREGREIVSDAARARQRKSLTQEEIDAIGVKARAEGLKSGEVRAAEKTAAAVEACARAVREALSRCQGDIDTVRENATKIAVAVARKLAGAALAACPEAEIERTFREAIRQATGEARIVLRTAPNVVDVLAPRIEDIARQEGHQGDVAISADPTLAAPDCRIEWPGGGLERNLGKIDATIDDLIARRFANDTTTGHGKG